MKRTRKILILFFWLLVWEVLALIVHNPILIAGPVETVRALAALAVTESFWESLLFSFVRIVCGFLAGSAAGILLAWVSVRKPVAGEVLSPAVSVLKAVPVASFIILALIWFGAEGVSFFISFIVVFPVLYLNTLEGLWSADGKLLEMAEVYHVPSGARLKYIELPAVYPFLVSAFQLSAGMSWKSGIAAELIGQYKLSIGNQLYMDKISLDTAGICAWTVVIILISRLSEKVFLSVIRMLSPEHRAGRKQSRRA